MEKSPSNYTHLIAGFTGGLTSAVCLQPLDLLKTRIQQDKTSFKKVVAQIRSPLELWRGTLPSALRTSIGSALYLTSLNAVRTSLVKLQPQTDTLPSSSKLPKLSSSLDLAAGAVTRGLVGLLTMPITILKVRFESSIYQYDSLSDAMKQILKNEGLAGFFRGYGATCLRDCPYAGLYVLFYQKCKSWAPLFVSDTDASPTHLYTTSKSTAINSCSALVAACMATALTSPFDTIKTNMQLNPHTCPTFWQTCRVLVASHWTHLFDGISLRISRKAFSAAIAWAIYEEIIKFGPNT
ncbi:hypothetical protein KL918_005005 [Ogataea parapolymorpha]|uniref:Mitochondrial glycine transporter n=1 Tax=Ogataea parapolymorpha (strain ATCC 26012 / BCRC 20466 / JCM 22074 / NRRL Y-7560 / DL-1) TaxID=871575 RepID=W1QGK8_OGAPD|nr:putative mitochondrial carrier protein [Ogataea parapolymorpha DL-1]ESX00215.1 putative mitochondrial carrier protein [Ogataea parapolymorpha DL-1]KAG7865129.1 hypothetical protein KL918_005005 [Ogataea parapolymorpha]KAG7872185.1 hypothetical protein KL916_003208 [Ogataea parapolymorpha]